MKALKREAYWLGRSVMMSLLVNLFIESASRKSIFAAVGYLVLHPVIFLLNGLIILLPYMLVFLTRRRYFVMAAVSMVWCCAGVVNGFLLTFRTTPFTAADLRLIKYALNMLTMYMTWWQIILAAAGIIGAVLACVWCYRKAPVIEKGLNLPVKVAVAAASLVVVIGTVPSVQEVQPYCSMWNAIYDCLFFCINGDIYDSMTPEQQEVIDECGRLATQYEREINRAGDDEIMNRWQNENGVTITNYEDMDIDSFKQAVDGVDEWYQKELEGQGYDDAKELIETFTK